MIAKPTELRGLFLGWSLIPHPFSALWTAGLVFFSVSALPPCRAAEKGPAAVRFNRDIRPLLSDACFKCHGPDSTQRKAGLRFDTREGLFQKRDGESLVVPGKPEQSELYRRITSRDADLRMPPPDSGRKLTPQQIALIRRWIQQGAPWEPHWAFLPPKRPAVPTVKNSRWVRNPIDAFILARLEEEGLSPSPAAAKTTLLRRVTLDLTGLPPTLAELDAFLADQSPDAYEKVVDRLLRSQRFGEKMAMHWLDAARYADTSGYQNDGPREMWRWRDWVIEAFNRNKPFDQFTVEQLAGDLLPNATLEQIIATGFNRNHRGNSEGGVIPEEFQVEYVVDRVETTFTVFQGLTMGCVRCHEHKFDPISQKEFYRVFAYFNNIPENGRAIKEGNSPPFIKAPTREQQKQLQQLNRQLQTAEKRFRLLQPRLRAAQKQWERKAAGRFEGNSQWTITEGLSAHFPFNGEFSRKSSPLKALPTPDSPRSADSLRSDAKKNSATQEKTAGKKKAAAKKPAAKTLTVGPAVPRFEDGTPLYADGMQDRCAVFDGKHYVNAGDVGGFGYFDKFSVAAWIFPAETSRSTILSRMTDVEQGDGWMLQLHNGRLQFNLVKRWLDDSIRVETQTTLPAGQWTHITATYDGSRKADGIRIYLNGVPQNLTVRYDFLNQSFASKEPLRIGAGNGPANRFRGKIDDVRIYTRDLSATEAAILSVPEPIAGILQQPPDKRSAAQRHKVRWYYLTQEAPADLQQAWRTLQQLRRQKRVFVESLPTVMVMQEMKTPRPTFLLRRGEYDKPGERVFPGVPAVLSPGLKRQPKNRLEFARWLVSRQNPLTARVTVNRFWQMLFGTGIVKTAEDFGSQGEPPSHPELLDWLAVEFMETGWDVKRLLKMMVMSATYRQSSALTPTLLSRDPDNRLLARGPRFRLPAETIRDQALFVAGLLTEKIGGPSVRPYQPAGLWKEIATVGTYRQSHGADLYRRSLYTYWKRTVAPPVMVVFDAPAREFCRVRRPRTNTPLQALALLNEVSFVEAARKLAERALTEGGASDEERIAYLFRLATSRHPSEEERRLLLAGFRAHLAKYRLNRKAAEQLLSMGESPRNRNLDNAALAAGTVTASLILNLDEVVTKE